MTNEQARDEAQRREKGKGREKRGGEENETFLRHKLRCHQY